MTDRYPPISHHLIALIVADMISADYRAIMEKFGEQMKLERLDDLWHSLADNGHQPDWLQNYLLIAGQVEQLEKLLASGLVLNIHQGPVVACAIKGRMNSLEFLEKINYDLTFDNHDAFTQAAEHDRIDVVRFLAKFKPTQTALDEALIRATVHSMCHYDEFTTSYLRSSPMEMIMTLVELGANVNAKDGECLIKAASRYNDQPFDYMIENCRVPNKTYDMAIIKVAGIGSIAHLNKLLLRVKPDADTIVSAMCNAALEGQREMVQELAKHASADEIRESPYYKHFCDCCRNGIMRSFQL